MKRRLDPSHLAFAFVVVVAGGSFLWWARSRPSFLLFQAHSRLGKANESAVIHEYKRILSRPNIPKEKEIQFRKALGEFYVRAIQENNSISVFSRDKTKVDHPYLKEAKSEFNRVLALDPNDSSAHHYLGRILLFEQLESYALEELEKSRALAPDNPEPALVLSQVYRERGDGAKARDLAEQALAIAPHSDEARMALISAYDVLGEHEKAFQEYEALSPLYRRLPLTRAQHALHLAEQNHWDEALAEIRNAVDTEPANGWIRIFHARLLMEQNASDQAAAELAQAETLMPRNVWPLVWSAEAMASLGRCEDSARLSQYLIEGLPRWPWSHWAGALHQLCQGRDLLALSSLNEALRFSPDLFEAIRLKSAILMDKGQYDALGPLLRPLLDKKRGESFAYSVLAQSLYEQGRMDLCLDSAEQAISSNQRNAWGFIWLALARQELRLNDAAHRALRQGVDLRPFDPGIRACEAIFHAQGGDFGRAESILETFVQERSRNPYVWIALGVAKEKKQHFPEAALAYQRAAELRPYLINAHLGLVRVYAALGEKEKAFNSLKRAFEINPKNKAVLTWRGKI